MGFIYCRVVGKIGFPVVMSVVGFSVQNKPSLCLGNCNDFPQTQITEI